MYSDIVTSTFQTHFELSGAGLPPYSARGGTQTLGWIGAATYQRRTVNGAMKDLALPQFRLFAIGFNGQDQRPPFAYRPGAIVTLYSAQLLGYKTVGGTKERPKVPESTEIIEGDWTFYRPMLECMVESVSMNFEEWTAGQSWSIALNEIGGT